MKIIRGKEEKCLFTFIRPKKSDAAKTDQNSLTWENIDLTKYGYINQPSSTCIFPRTDWLG